MKIHVFPASEIKEAFQENRRQYLVGNLQFPQNLCHFQSRDLEIGISSYQEDQIELPHFHSDNSEYIYMIHGRTEYLDVETKEVYSFQTGDFFIIQPNTIYAQRVKKGTELLFVKYPSGNDKITVDCSPFVTKWLNEAWQ